jgi:hypothetical protein
MKKVPKQIVVSTDANNDIAQIIDSFFIQTKEHIENKYPTDINYFEKKHAQLYYDGKPTDEEIITMRCQGIFVAGVLATRTESNNIQYTFFRSLDKIEKHYKKNI